MRREPGVCSKGGLVGLVVQGGVAVGLCDDGTSPLSISVAGREGVHAHVHILVCSSRDTCQMKQSCPCYVGDREAQRRSEGLVRSCPEAQGRVWGSSHGPWASHPSSSHSTRLPCPPRTPLVFPGAALG